MSVYRPKNSPYYHYDFQIKGNRFFGTTGAKKKSKADLIEAQEKEKAVLYGGRKRRQPMTLDIATGRYYTEIAEHQPSKASTFYQLANLTAGFGKETLLCDITDNEIAEQVSRRRGQNSRRGGKLSPASVNRETQLLKRVFRRADMVWKAEIGDMPNWRAHMLKEPAGRTRELTDAEEQALFAKLRDDFHPFIQFALKTGVRLKNARALTWTQIDYGTNEITFRIKSDRPGGEVHVVPITAAIKALLADQRGNHPIYVFTYVCKRSRGLRQKGERYPFSASGWRRDWKAALKEAAIEDFRFHDTRHTAATRTLRATNNLKVVQQQLGHASIASTARYAHASVDDVRRAMEAVESRNNPGEIKGAKRKPLNKGA